MIKKGVKVLKSTGDYRFEGIVVAAFKKLSGSVRYVVENKDGVLFIFNRNMLEIVDD